MYIELSSVKAIIKAESFITYTMEILVVYFSVVKHVVIICNLHDFFCNTTYNWLAK